MRGLKNAFFVKGGGAWWGYLIMEVVDVKEEVFTDMTTKEMHYFEFLCLLRVVSKFEAWVCVKETLQMFPSGKAKASKCRQILQM